MVNESQGFSMKLVGSDQVVAEAQEVSAATCEILQYRAGIKFVHAA
jgi:hypothetical protein